jgi:hypothetical protein
MQLGDESYLLCIMNRSVWFPSLCCSVAALSVCFGETPPGDTSVGITETAGNWSGIVDQVRGRLIATTTQDSHGATEVRVYVELQNLDAQPFFGKKISFDRDTSLEWKMTDASGKMVPAWKEGVPWQFEYMSSTFSITVLGDSTLRFPVCTADYCLLEDSHALLFFQGPMNTPPWHIASKGPVQYFLGANFRGLEKGEVPTQYIWSGPISLPPMRLPTSIAPMVWSGNSGPPLVGSQIRL